MNKCGVNATEFKLHPGELLIVKGTILSECKEFVINLGKDRDNLALHFNPRFDCKGDERALVCNSKRTGVWEEEITFSFTDHDIRVNMEGCEEIVFPNRLELNVIDYLVVGGDFRIKSVTFP